MRNGENDAYAKQKDTYTKRISRCDRPRKERLAEGQKRRRKLLSPPTELLLRSRKQLLPDKEPVFGKNSTDSKAKELKNTTRFPEEEAAFGANDRGLMDRSAVFEDTVDEGVNEGRMGSDAVNNGITAQHQQSRTDRQPPLSGDFSNDDSESNNYKMRLDSRAGNTTIDDGDSGFDEECVALCGGHTVDIRDAGQVGSSQSLDRRSHDTCGYLTKSSVDQVCLGSQMNHTATREPVGDSRIIGLSCLRMHPTT
ncbi:hypothetical protein FN846DRAFT_892929 [Sphaerosporella brunnea]|uniref:Uncharacterized protein n=1 Tax=Sphaerosporella brunnea TaxID=1250544 RepID=A0A5J5EMJ4_9PEZI|nr:hypothetical protein FN846DRAFT_892929 [Sphaerosporella brunnea]